MYIINEYWGNYIGDTDDSLTLIDYLADKNKANISVGEIFADVGLDKLKGNFRQHDMPLTVVLSNSESDYSEPYAEFYYAIDLIADLAALLLECRVNGSINMHELTGCSSHISEIHITAESQEHKLINRALMDFVSEPLAYDLSEMCSEEDMLKMADVCKKLREELYGKY